MHGSRIKIVVAFALGLLVASGPQIAIAAFDAVNADKVDGRHAVGATATAADRAGKLVATNSAGRLPNDIIARAPNSDRLDGLDGTAYQQRVTGVCPDGQLATAVGTNGSLSCSPDDVNGGNAETLDGVNGTDYQRRLQGSCLAAQKMLTAGADGALTCAADQIDGGNAETLDALNSTAFEREPARTVVVGPVGTAAQNGAALLAALAGIPTTGPTAPAGGGHWLLKIEPGVYQLLSPNRLIMRNFVDIEGSGPETLITCSCGGTMLTNSATVNTVANAQLRSLTINNIVSNTSFVMGVYGAAPPTLIDVTVNASSSSNTLIGILTAGNGTTVLRNVTVGASNADDVAGIQIESSKSLIDHANVTVATAPELWAIKLTSPAAGNSNVIRETTAVATGGNEVNEALRAAGDGVVQVHDSFLTASGTAPSSVISFAGTTVNIAASMLDGPVTNVVSQAGQAVFKCVGAFNGSYTARNSTCL